MRGTLFLLLGAFTSASVSASTPGTTFLNNLPLRFEEDRARNLHKNSHYIARGPNFALSLAPDQNWLEWSDRSHHKTAHVRTRLRNANPSARMLAEDRLPGSANYFIGEPEQWHTDVTGFSRVRYQDVYPGIDLIFHGERGRLEYDFVLAAKADPSAIRLELSGHREAHIADDGDLVVSTDAGDIRWKRPEIYQSTGGVHQPVAGRFRLSGRLVRFEIDAYDHERPLVIDPVLKYSTYIGNRGNDSARGIAVDGAGNVYVAGATSSSDLNTRSAYQPNFGGMTTGPLTGDGFVAKFSPSGTLLYLTYLGGAQDDGVAAIAVDSTGNAYLTGATNSGDFPTVNPFQANFAGLGGSVARSGDAFVAKLNPTGNKLLYSTYLGGAQDDIGLAIAIDGAGNAYVAGATASTNFPLTPGGGEYQPKFGGIGGEPIRHETDTVPEWEPGDAFAAKLDPTGSKLLFSTFLGGSQDDAAFSIAIDSSNNVYVGGCTISSNFPTKNALQKNYGGADFNQNIFFSLGDGFLVKLKSDGSDAVYSTYFGGSGDDCITSIALDSAGDVYMTGTTTTQDLSTSPGAFLRVYQGYFTLPFLIAMGFGDAFVAKLDSTGSKLLYLTYLGGSFNDGGTAIAVDSAGDAYVTGFTDSLNFPVTPGALQTSMAGDGGIGQFLFYGDAFLTVLNPTGTGVLYSSYFGGNEDERTFGLALDSSGTVYIVGNTVSTNLPTTPNALQRTFGGFDGHVPGAMRGDAYLAIFSGFPIGPPVITKVANAESQSVVIGPNTWTEIDGTSLAANARSWQASDFVNNQLPTALDGIGVTMNGKKAFVSSISGSRLEVLTPPDLALGPVQVQVSNGFVSAPFVAQSQQYSLALSVLGGGPYVLATHADGSLIGPAGLFPGPTPAVPDETIMVYANGFGPTVPPVVSGSVVQAGALPALPVVQIGGAPANVTSAALVFPGFYRFTITVPSSAGNGDVSIVAQYAGQSTQAGVLLALRQ